MAGAHVVAPFHRDSTFSSLNSTHRHEVPSNGVAVSLSHLSVKGHGHGEGNSQQTDPSTNTTPSMDDELEQKANFEKHMSFLGSQSGNGVEGTFQEESKTTPLFSGHFLKTMPLGTISQYGLLAARLPLQKGESDTNLLDDLTPDHGEDGQILKPKQSWLDTDKILKTVEAATTPMESRPTADFDPRVFINISAPWSAFICGSQGSGKSHTLSCMLESALMGSELGRLPNPLAAMVFHYDRFTSYASNQVCEAAYLCSSGIPVKVLVSPTNYWRMKDAYENLPGLPANTPKPLVVSLRFKESHLDVNRIMNLMAVNEKGGPMPLYIEVRCYSPSALRCHRERNSADNVQCILRILRQMAMESRGARGLDFNAFEARLEEEGFSDKQNGPLRLRMELIKSFMEERPVPGSYHASMPTFGHNKKGYNAKQAYVTAHSAAASDAAWTFDAGSLTIVDLSCPFVDDSAACALFNICMELFLEARNVSGRLLALDEAHKFLTGSDAATRFTDNLLQVVRQQRHLAARVIVATQEPTLAPRLLDLCTITIVHRFTSPEWMRALRAHLASVSSTNASNGNGHGGSGDTDDDARDPRDLKAVFHQIVNLSAGEALLFAPSAMLDVAEDRAAAGAGSGVVAAVQKLGMSYAKIRVRNRLTADGGKSILAR